MRITCPNCSAVYQIPDERVAKKAISVRCANCSTTWSASGDAPAQDAGQLDSEQDTKIAESAQSEESFDEPDWGDLDDQISDQQAGDAAPANESATPAEAEPNSLTTMAAEDAPTEGETLDIEKVAKAGQRKKPSRRRRSKARLPGVIAARLFNGLPALVAAILIFAAAALLREPIVRMVPDLASAYKLFGMEVNLRGLAFNRVQTFREVAEGRPVLVVEGFIRNLNNAINDVPAIRFAIRGRDAQEIYAWLVELKSQRMRPGANIRFRTRVNAPPETAFDLQLRFVERRKRTAGL